MMFHMHIQADISTHRNFILQDYSMNTSEICILSNLVELTMNYRYILYMYLIIDIKPKLTNLLTLFDVISCETFRFRQEPLPQPWSDLIKIFLPIFFIWKSAPTYKTVPREPIPLILVISEQPCTDEPC